MDSVNRYIEQVVKYSTPEKPYWNVEKKKQSKKTAWHYVDCLMAKALLDMYDVSGNSLFLEFTGSFIDYYIDEEGNITGYDEKKYNLDSLNGGRVLLSLYGLTKKDKYHKAVNRLFTQLENQPRTESGNFWHKKIYPNQIWLDGVYMALPFYMAYDNMTAEKNEFSVKKYYPDITEQILNVEKLMKDPKTGLYFHGYDESRVQLWSDKKTGCSPNIWGRAMGWFLMALVDILEIMDTQFYNEYREILRVFQEAVEAIKKYQDSSGMWYQVLNRPGGKDNYLETSVSAMTAYALMKGSRLGFLDYQEHRTGRNAFEGIISRYLHGKKELSLGGICLVAGLGGKDKRDGSYGYYVSEKGINDDGKGAGPFILAYTEVIRAERENKTYLNAHLKKER